jgi:hypothetical protein
MTDSAASVDRTSSWNAYRGGKPALVAADLRRFFTDQRPPSTIRLVKAEVQFGSHERGLPPAAEPSRLGHPSLAHGVEREGARTVDSWSQKVDKDHETVDAAAARVRSNLGLPQRSCYRPEGVPTCLPLPALL